MDPVHIFFKELEIDQNNTFTANVSQESKVENVTFNSNWNGNKTRYCRF